MLYKAMVATALMAAQPVEGIQKLRLQGGSDGGEGKAPDEGAKNTKKPADDDKAKKAAKAKEELETKLKEAKEAEQKACEGEEKAKTDGCKAAKEATEAAQKALDDLNKTQKEKPESEGKGCSWGWPQISLAVAGVAIVCGVAYCMMKGGGDEEESTRASRASQ